MSWSDSPGVQAELEALTALVSPEWTIARVMHSRSESLYVRLQAAHGPPFMARIANHRQARDAGQSVDVDIGDHEGGIGSLSDERVREAVLWSLRAHVSGTMRGM